MAEKEGSHVFSVSLPMSLYKRAKELAEKDPKVSLAALIRVSLDKYVRARERKEIEGK